MKHPAFTIIEVTLYTAINTILVIIIFSVVTNIQKTMLEQQNIRTYAIQDTLVLSLLWRDIISASCNSSLWEREKLIFKREIYDQQGKEVETWIGWECCNQASKRGLNRIEGLYNHQEHRWLHKKKTDFFGCSLTDIAHNMLISPKTALVTGVTMSYASNAVPDSNSKKMTFFIALRNRLLGDQLHVVT